jgi:preprotein translocase subunit SecE
MNREQKRMMQRQGQAPAEGGASSRRDAAVQAQQRRSRERTTIKQFFREIREEMRQVAWPSRGEVRNYTGIVLFVLIFMTLLIFGLGLGFSKLVTFMYAK